MVCLRVHEFMHTAAGFAGVAGIRKASRQFFKEVKRVARGLCVAFGQILTRDRGQNTVAFV